MKIQKQLAIFLIILLYGHRAFAQPDWQIDPNEYQYSMTVTSLLEVDGEMLSGENHLVAAFQNGVIRGVARPTVYIASLNQYLAFLTVFSNSVSDEEISFMVYDATNDREVEVLIRQIFTDGSQIGTNTDPKLLSNMYEWNGADWEHGSTPAVGSSIRLSGDYNTTSGSIEAYFLQVQNGVSLLVNSGESVKVTGKIDNQGSVLVASGGALVTMGEVTGSGFQIERFTTFDQNTGRYSVLGAPIQNASFDFLGVGAAVYVYDETEAYHPSGNVGLSRFKTPAQLSLTEMEPGKGYFSAFTGDENGKVIFEGTINSGNIIVPLSYTDHGEIAEENFQGYNLVANPYPAAISFQEFMNGNTSANIDGSIYLWDDFDSENGRGTNQDYLIVNASLGNTDSRSGGESKWDGYIRSGQGFFVKANSSTNLIFTDAMKAPSNNSDGGFFRQTNMAKYKIRLTGADQSKATIIGLLEDATTGHDPAYDAIAMTNPDLSIASLSETGQLMAIQALPEAYDQPIPLSISVPGVGEYQIDLMNEISQSVWLHDKQTGENVDLSMNSFQFTATEAGIVSRFEINRKRKILYSDEWTDLKVYVAEKRLFIRDNNLRKTNLKVFSLTGQELLSQTVQGRAEIDLNFLPKGVYLLVQNEKAMKFLLF